MPIADITNPAIIKFLVENYDKTARLRMKWNKKNEAGIILAATLHREEKGYYETDVLYEAMACGLPTITRDHNVAGRNRRVRYDNAIFVPGVAHLRKGHSIQEVGLGDVEDDPRLGRPDTDLSLDPKMRPIDKKQRKIIYKDIPMFGREVYLKSRVKISPENRYYFRETGGWEYGWRLKDSYFGNNAPKFGRVWRLTRDVLSRTGPERDPDYYGNSEAAGPSKCQE